VKSKSKTAVLVLSILFLCTLGLLLFGRTFPSLGITLKTNSITINSLKIDRNIFYRQTLNNCGPYSVMAVINILKQETIDPEILAQEIKWRIYKNLTFPLGIGDLLKKYNIETKEYVLWNYNEDDKISWLKNMIDEGKPIILLIEINHIKHYFTVLGYDKEGFMIYDSLQEKRIDNQRMTIIDKEDYVGNRYYNAEYLIRLWKDGGFKIFFQSWALVCNI